MYFGYAKEGEFKISSAKMKFIEHSFSTVSDFLKAPLKYTYAKVIEYVDGSTKHKAYIIGALQFFNFKKYKEFITKQIRKQSKQKGA